MVPRPGGRTGGEVKRFAFLGPRTVDRIDVARHSAMVLAPASAIVGSAPRLRYARRRWLPPRTLRCLRKPFIMKHLQE